jgi:hypothetical protein
VINTTTHDDPDSWRLAILDKCDLDSDDLADNSIFVRKALRNMFTPNSTFICFTSIMLYSLVAKVPIDQYKTGTCLKIMLRVILTISVTVPAIPLLFIPSDSPLAVVIIFSEFLVGGWIVFSVYFITKLLMHRVKVLEPVDKIGNEYCNDDQSDD